MLHVLIISLFMVVVLHDSVAAVLGESGDGAARFDPAVWALSLLPMAVLAGGTCLALSALSTQVRRGSMRAVRTAERLMSLSRWTSLLLHAGNILVIGLLDQVRLLIGDLVAIDELIVIALPLSVFVAGWWAYEPIDRLLRESAALRTLDEGRPIFRPPTRRQYVLLNLRHQILLSLVPIGLVAVWGEGSQRALDWLAAQTTGPLAGLAEQLHNPGMLAWVDAALKLAGVAVVFTMSPLLLRRVWDTVRLGPGPLRERLSALCARSGVRIRELLVWRTHGTLINGAVIGLVGPLRYILLTDALLEHLPARQVEAVMAHEVGHARHSHMPWLALSMLAGIASGAMIISLAVWGGAELAAAMGQAGFRLLLPGTVIGELVIATGSLVLGLAWFGFVSRRFEWQADAFAVKTLSRIPAADDGQMLLWESGPPAPPIRPTSAPADRITPEAVLAMNGALEAVADLNHMSRMRPSWRHGSIAYRQARLAAVVGQPMETLRIDRTVRTLKRAVGLMLAGLVALAVWAQFS